MIKHMIFTFIFACQAAFGPYALPNAHAGKPVPPEDQVLNRDLIDESTITCLKTAYADPNKRACIDEQMYNRGGALDEGDCQTCSDSETVTTIECPLTSPCDGSPNLRQAAQQSNIEQLPTGQQGQSMAGRLGSWFSRHPWMTLLGGLAVGGALIGGFMWWKNKRDKKNDKNDNCYYFPRTGGRYSDLITSGRLRPVPGHDYAGDISSFYRRRGGNGNGYGLGGSGGGRWFTGGSNSLNSRYGSGYGYGSGSSYGYGYGSGDIWRTGYNYGGGFGNGAPPILPYPGTY